MKRRLFTVGLMLAAAAAHAHAETATYCVRQQAPRNYEKYHGATVQVNKTEGTSVTMSVRYATGGSKSYTLPFLFNDMYSNEDTFISVTFRENGSEIYFSDPDHDDWFSAKKCG